ncbi:STAS domain-containing protein [Kitasatospora sp. NPDC017646]|uniref:STAS domain-containing protein n=1 Tax=Kitasatospora sp. NPDC017646 TaxID=3364024 RepID=UPI00379A9E23
MSAKRIIPADDSDTIGPCLRITTLSTGETVVCRLAGEIDQVQRPKLGNALARAVSQRPHQLIVDMAAVSFCDSSGPNALLQTLQDAALAGTLLVLTSLPPQVRRLLEVTGTDEVFTIRDSVYAALHGDRPHRRSRP